PFGARQTDGGSRRYPHANERNVAHCSSSGACRYSQHPEAEGQGEGRPQTFSNPDGPALWPLSCRFCSCFHCGFLLLCVVIHRRSSSRRPVWLPVCPCRQRGMI